MIGQNKRIIMKKVFYWGIRLLPAVIMLQTLFFKFTAAPEPVHIFSILLGDHESIGRIGTGILELIAGLLLIYPRTSVFGALLGAGTMSGAIASHFFFLGISVHYYDKQHVLINDHGTLFISAMITLACCVILLYQNKNSLLNFFNPKYATA
jgi:uncharacterized membrane protein YphA (DoxX/SURF4 family)